MNAIRPSWAIIMPTTLTSMTSWFLVRKACYAWRDLLCDGITSGFYRVPSLREREFVHECTGDPATALEPIAPERNLGTHVTEEFVTAEESDFLLEELQDLLIKYGRGFGERAKGRMREDLSALGIDPNLVDQLVYISDMHQDVRAPKGVWRPGDAMALDQLPMAFRRLGARVQEHFPNVGELRHVYVFHSPSGLVYRPPEPIHAFAGHEFMIVPLARRDRVSKQGGLVFTVSPTNRSRKSVMEDVVRSSWSQKDQDTYTPFRALLRVYGSARLKCGLGVRPVQYFGDASNPLPLDHETMTAQHRGMRPGTWAAGADGRVVTPMEAAARGGGGTADAGGRPWWRRLLPAPAASDRAASKSGRLTADDVAAAEDSEAEVAYVMLGFEGPMHETKTRNKWKRWEMYAYGYAPKAHEFEKLEEDPMVGEEEVGEWYQVPLWMIRNYWSIGRMGAS